jgi:glycosyltransferase involved in cell wall biosynthesis
MLKGFNQLKKLKQSQTAKVHPLICEIRKNPWDSVDPAPWFHPYLNENNIRRFREYSEAIWHWSMDYSRSQSRPLKIAFAVNMAQSMYKWARLAQKYHARPTLFLNPMDYSALSLPEWEDYDGEYPDILDGTGFLNQNKNLKAEVPCERFPMEGSEILDAYQAFGQGKRKPFLSLLAQSPGLHHEILFSYQGVHPYYPWAKALSRFDAVYISNSAIPAYISGRPYCAFSCGADLQFDAGRGDDFGEISVLSFNAARFLLLTNPHALGHCRRLGLTNGVYLPYPMDDERYCPGIGKSREEWIERYGVGVFVLMTSRIDPGIKGQNESFFQTLVEVAQQRPQLRFIFLSWGENVSEFRRRIEASGLPNQFLLFPPVGKKRLIDYYRSCDMVLDQFVFGYYGATGLEAASIGKPIIMKIKKEHYAPLYRGDIMPALNADTPAEMGKALLELADHDHLRVEMGTAMRQWLVRNHGEAKTVPLLLSLLRVTADQAPLPPDLKNPLMAKESIKERIYHSRCLVKRPQPS